MPLDSATFLRDFLTNVGTSLDDHPDPFDYESLDAATAIGTLPARLRGKLAQLREKEKEITDRYTSETGAVKQRFISRGGNRTGYHSELRDLHRNKEKECSEARERWFYDLAADEKATIDNFCLAVGGPILLQFLPSDVPGCLQGALARLALETAGITRVYEARRAELKQSLSSQGLANPSVISSLSRRMDEDAKTAKAALVARWLRELTPEQEAACDGANGWAESAPIQPTSGDVIGELASTNASGRKTTPISVHDAAKPRKYLTNWREILVCLELNNNDEKKRFVAEMNRKFDGPIKLPRRGGQPKVDKAKLVEWWNHLESQWETQGSGQNTVANVERQYQHGRDETVVPEIAGHVKKRRNRRK